jgi:hypothetical protein
MPFLHVNPQDFALHIFVELSENSEAEFVVELPTSRWIPRIGETLIFPMKFEEQSVTWEQGFVVKDVTYDFIRKTVVVDCEIPKEGQWKWTFPFPPKAEWDVDDSLPEQGSALDNFNQRMKDLENKVQAVIDRTATKFIPDEIISLSEEETQRQLELVTAELEQLKRQMRLPSPE